MEQIYCVPGTTCNVLPLEKRKILKKTISVLFGFIIIMIIFFLVFLVNMFQSGILAGMFGVMFLVLLFIILVLGAIIFTYQSFYYKNYFYNLKKEEMYIKKGVISRMEISMPYHKVQNVYVDQDVWDRIFQLYDVHLETAGGYSGMAAHIDGLNSANAHKLRDMILDKIKKHKN